jgi:hypothetical protein
MLTTTSKTTSKSKAKPDLSLLPTVAWMGEDYEGRGAIVWAKTRGQARAIAAAELDRDFREIVSVRRYPQLDGFTGNLRRYQMSHGWRWECQKCDRPCYGQDEGADLDPAITTVIDNDDNVFCSPACCAAYNAYWSLHRAIDAAILEDFKKLHPDVEVPFPSTSVGHNEWYGWVWTDHQQVLVWEMVSVHQQHGGTWRAARGTW